MEEVNEVYMGNVLQGFEGQAPCRQATLGAGYLTFLFFFVFFLIISVFLLSPCQKSDVVGLSQ